MVRGDPKGKPRVRPEPTAKRCRQAASFALSLHEGEKVSTDLGEQKNIIHFHFCTQVEMTKNIKIKITKEKTFQPVFKIRIECNAQGKWKFSVKQKQKFLASIPRVSLNP